MLRWSAFVLAVAISGIFAAPSVADSTGSKSSLVAESDRTNRHFVIASSNNFPPVNQLDEDGNLIGFGIDISNAVVEAIGGTYSHIHSGIWTDVLKWLAEGRADFIHDTGYSAERMAYLDYSKPILVMPEEIFVRVDRYDIAYVDDLKDNKVACVNKHITHLYLQNIPGIVCHVVATPVDGLYALLNGDVGAFIFPRQVLLHIAQRLGVIDRLKVVGDPLRELTWHMTVRKGDQEMLSLLNQGIAEIRESGQYDAIYEHWFGRVQTLGYSPKEMMVIVVVAVVLSLALGILLVIFFRMSRMAKVQKSLKKSLEHQEQSDRALRASERRLSLHIQNTPLGCISWDRNINCTEWNKAAEKIFGYTAEEAIGKNGYDLIISSGIKDEIDIVYNSLLEQEGGISNTNENVTKDGRTITCNWYNTPLEDANGEVIGVVALVQDVTDRKRAETQLIQSAKLASLGELATSAAHEINQPLNIIRMSADTLAEMLEEEGGLSSDFLKTRLERITTQTKRAAGIIDRMRVFGRSPLEHATKILPKDAVLGAVGLLSEQLRLSDIELTLNIPETCRSFMGDLIQLEQVVLNLLTNARDAIDDKVETVTRGDGTNKVTVSIDDDPATDVIKIIVVDTGGGIPQDVLPNVFDPFLTTKEIGKGTGLGLSISHGIITEIGGTITAENADGGAMFTVTLPVADEEPDQA